MEGKKGAKNQQKALKKALRKLKKESDEAVEKLGGEVIKSIKKGHSNHKVEKISEIVMKRIFKQDKRDLTIGQRTADWMTTWAGSWIFIFSFFIFLGVWMSLNIYAWIEHWDPYPFILLNLVLSCLAAIQAPIILMSQNRQSEKDRRRAEYDYQVNRRAEREIKQIKKQLNRIEGKIK
jgi:uncharacterized membrane protein